jgi:hypothetical protein
MANQNFVVHNGLTVGGFVVDATTSNVTLPVTKQLAIGNVILRDNGDGKLRVRDITDNSDAEIVATLAAVSTTAGNIQIGTNHIESTNPNGPISLRPNGNGNIAFSSNTIMIGHGGAFTLVGTGIQTDPIYGINYPATNIIVTMSAINSSGNLRLSMTTPASSTTTGALQVSGGVGVVGTVVAGQLNTSGNVLATAGTFNALTVNGNETVTGLLNVTGNISTVGTIAMNLSRITGLGTPVDSNDATTKQYVDSVAEGLSTKPAVEVATTGNLTASYNNGTLGVGATLTATSNGAFPNIDGITLTSINPGENGVLVKNQTPAAWNGRYNLTQVGSGSTPWILTRCGLCDEKTEIPGAYIFVKAGTVNKGTGWVQTVDNPATFVVGTDAITVNQFSGAGTYLAGTGLTLTGGTTFSVNASQTQITELGILTGLNSTGNILATGAVFNSERVNGTSTVNVLNSTGNILATGAVFNSERVNGTSTVNVLNSTGNILGTGGILSSLTVNGNVVVTSAYAVPSANAASSLGTSATRWNFVYGVNGNFLSVNANYADLAENYLSDAEYLPGTVLMFGGEQEVTECNHDMCTKVAGVVSTNPGYLMNQGLEGEYTVELALTGRVPTKVTGTVRKGDMMVSAGNGRARAEDNPRVGSVIGKALENSEGDTVIEVVVGKH